MFLFSNNRNCLINKRTFICHLLYARGFQCHVCTRSLSSLSCTGVIWVSALGRVRAGRSEQSESHWTRQKCSGAPANTLPPRPSVEGPFLLPLSPLFSLPSPRPRHCSVCRHNDATKNIIWNLTEFFLQSPCHVLGIEQERMLNTKLTIHWVERHSLRRRDFLQQMANLFFHSLHVFCSGPLRLNHLNKKVLF